MSAVIFTKVKVCSKCGIPKTHNDYDKRTASKDGLTARCKQCLRTKALKSRNDNPDLTRSKNLKHRFNISIEQYNKMFLQQRGKCAICHKAETAGDKNGNVKWLSIDHNHKTNDIRGLLCNGCNTGIGLLKDNIDVLHSAIKYLTERGSYGKE